MSERGWIAAEVVTVVGVLATATYFIVVSANSLPLRVTTVSAGPDASLIAETVRSPSPSPSPSATVATVPSAAPTPTRRPMAVSPYRCLDRACTGVQLGAGWTVIAPYDGRVELHVYQLVDGQIREFTDALGAKYPYIDVVAGDGRRMRFRPGALGTNAELIVWEGPVKAGDDLFRVAGSGPSSWRDLYDAAIPYQIVVSLANAAGADLDAAPLIKAR